MGENERKVYSEKEQAGDLTVRQKMHIWRTPSNPICRWIKVREKTNDKEK